MPKKRYEYNGDNLTITEWSQKTGIKRSAIHQRLKNGWELGQALGFMPRDRHEKTYEYDGCRLTITEWSHRTGVDRQNVYKRLHDGWTFGQAIGLETRPNFGHRKGKEAKKYEHNGKVLTLRQWAEEAGVNYNSFRGKINEGYSIGQAIGFGRARKKRNLDKDLNGKEWTIKEISEYTGLPAATLYDYERKIALKKHEWNNQTLTLDQWEKELGIPHKILYGLLESGLSFDQIIERFKPNPESFSEAGKHSHDEQPAIPTPSKSQHHMLTYNGETHSISEWARRLNIPRPTLSSRVQKNIRRGAKPEQALEPPEVYFEPWPENRVFDLREWRRPRGWTAAETGEYLGLSGSAVLMHERGDSPMSDMTKRLIDFIDKYGPLRNSDLPDSTLAWRTKHGWGPVEAAERLGIDYTTLWKHERLGRREKQLQRLMAYIDMELADREPPNLDGSSPNRYRTLG